MKAKVKRSPRRRYGLWLILGIIIGLAAVLTLTLSLFDIRRDMVFAVKKTIFRDEYIANIQWSPDESHILMQTSGTEFSTWDAQGNLIQEMFLPDIRGFGFGWNTQGKHFIQIHANGLLIFDLEGNVSAELPHVNIHRADWSPTGDRLFTISPEYLAIWRPDGYELARIGSSPDGYIYDLKWSPDGRYFFTYADNAVAVWDANAQMLFELPSSETTSSITQAIWAHDSSSILIDWFQYADDSQKFTLQHWDIQGNLLWEYPHDNLPTNRIEWSPDSTKIVLLTYDGSEALLQILNRAGEQVLSLENYNHFVWQPQGHYFLTQSYQNCPSECDDSLLFDTEGNLLQRVPIDDYLSADVWSPDGEYFLTWTTTPEDGYFALTVWDKEGNQVHRMLQPTSIQKAIWSPDGQHFITYGGFVARIYTLDAELIATLRHAQPIQSVQFSEDASRVMTVGQYGASGSVETAIWDVDGTHLSTVYTGLAFHSQIVAINRDFSQMLINKGNHVELRELQSGSIWFDFHWN